MANVTVRQLFNTIKISSFSSTASHHHHHSRLLGGAFHQQEGERERDQYQQQQRNPAHWKQRRWSILRGLFRLGWSAKDIYVRESSTIIIVISTECTVWYGNKRRDDVFVRDSHLIRETRGEREKNNNNTQDSYYYCDALMPKL